MFHSLRTSSSLVTTLFICGMLLATATGAVLLQKAGGMAMVQSAEAFIETLDADQKGAAVLPYNSQERVGWHFIPKPTRKGLVVREMNEAQKAAAFRLVRAALSESGYEKSRKIMLLESVLLELEGPGSKGKRDSEKYYVTIFGTPSEDAEWGFSFEGHHLSLNFTIDNGKIVDSTPQFFAANPATVMNDVSGPIKRGTRVLHDEEQLAFDLVNSLNKEQSEAAIFADKAPKEIGGAGEPQAPKTELRGVNFASMTGAQQQLLRSLINTYISAMPREVAADRAQILDKDGWSDIRFAWAGATKPGIGHYYRIQGKSFLVEFVNTQPDPAGNPANHIHCAWRDLTGDFNLSAK